MISRFYIICFFIALVTSCGKGSKEQISTRSPDGRLELIVNMKDSLSYAVKYDGKTIVNPSIIGLQLKGNYLGHNSMVNNIVTNNVNETLKPVYGKFAELSNHYNETIVQFDDNYSLVLRAYDEGVAYRFVTDLDGDIIVDNELFNIEVNPSSRVIYQETDNYTAWELMHVEYESTEAIMEGKRAITPVIFTTPEKLNIVVAESDIRSYPGMYLQKKGNGFTSDFAHYPDSTALGSWGFVDVVQRTRNHIAELSGKHNFPWRMIIVADDDKKLLTNELTYKLATPQAIDDVSWIKPGKAAWEWWHDAMLPDADIQSGMDNRNTALYKHYIDFAAEYGLEYLMIDAGWSDIFDLSKVNPKVDIQEVINYGKEKNVGVFLWCVAMALTDETTDKYMKMISDWGAVGLKVDFFDRDDQLAMDWYENIARVAAEHKLMINFHGCSKPTGLHRMYPNIVNYEAVRGGECHKWDLTANPKHHVTFPFNRMLGGSIDYTPGAMRNTSPQLFRPLDPGMPSAQGTRAHELAMFVVYDQYFAMLCDSPSEYRKDNETMKFLSKVPVSFDNTKILGAKIGEYILTAKKKGEEWYVGGMTNWTARNMSIDFSFLDTKQKYKMDVYRDAPESNLWAAKYVVETIDVDASTIMDFPLAQGGGLAIRIYTNE